MNSGTVLSRQQVYIMPPGRTQAAGASRIRLYASRAGFEELGSSGAGEAPGSVLLILNRVAVGHAAIMKMQDLVGSFVTQVSC